MSDFQSDAKRGVDIDSEGKDKCVQNKKIFYLKAAILSVAIIGLIEWFTAHYRIGIDGQEVRCLPDHSVFMVSLRDKEPMRGEIIAYYAQGLSPWFADGTLMAKIMTGMPGDRVRVDAEGVFVNGEQVAEGFPLAGTLEKSNADFFTEYTIPEHHYLMIAPAPESYDGRYWGLIKEDQIAGAATPLF